MELTRLQSDRLTGELAEPRSGTRSSVEFSVHTPWCDAGGVLFCKVRCYIRPPGPSS